MACRDIAAAKSARDEVRTALPGTSIEVVTCDLASLESVDVAVAQIAGEVDGVDLLVNNAGVMAVDAGRTVDGFETQLGVNYLGHFVLTAGLLPSLQRRPGARIAMAASNGHRLGRVDLDDPMFNVRRYDRWAAYFQSKLALQLFTLELSRRLTASSSPVLALSANPGAARTDLGREGHSGANALNRVVSHTFPSAARASRPMLRALTDPHERPVRATAPGAGRPCEGEAVAPGARPRDRPEAVGPVDRPHRSRPGTRGVVAAK
jgi:NAD(P)-dependent dehydrogenase (short-subunit alcohol dehydrogenase family)